MSKDTEIKFEKQEEELLKKEEALVAEEEKLVSEEKKIVKSMERNLWFQTGIVIFLILSLAGGLIYWAFNHNNISTDKAGIEAPLVDLAPQTSGTLEEVYVHEGDEVIANTPVARVGNQLVKSKVAGTIVNVRNDIGKLINPGEAVVTMIDPSELRVVARIDEDKGLSDISVGNRVTFTVDAYGSKQYTGVIDEISPTSRESGIVFNISDKREIKQFDVKARFNVTEYPEIKNGMSARMRIYY